MRPYACNGKPRPVAGSVTHLAQDGYHPPIDMGDGSYTRLPRWVEIRHVMTSPCVTGTKPEVLTDQRCAGCEHIKA